MAEIAAHFVSIVPSARGFGPALNKQIDSQAGAAGKQGGRKFGGAFFAGSKKAMVGFGAVLGAASLVGFAKDSIAAASDLEESINAVRVSYGKAGSDILKLGENSATAFGLSRAEFNGFAVQFQSFSKTIAGVDGDVSKTFNSIIGRATDFASVMNLEVGQAAELFQSGLAGETEPLRKYGIDLSAAAVEAYALKEGIAANKGELTEAMKVQARYGLLMQQTSKVQGDFANTSGGLANQQRILKANLEQVRADLGAALVPLFARASAVLNEQLVPAFTRFIGFLAANPNIIKGFAIALGLLAAAFTASFVAANLIPVAIAGLVAALIFAYGKSETFRKIVNAVFTGVKTVVVAAIKLIVATIKAGIATALAIFRGIRAVVGFVSGALGSARSTVSSAMSAIASTIRSRLNDAISFFRALPGRIRGALSGAGSALVGIGRNIVQGLISGIRGMGGAIKDALVGLLPGPLKKFAGKLGIASPSKLFAYYGEMTGLGFAVGVEGTQRRVDSAVDGLVGLPSQSRSASRSVATAGAGAGAAPGGRGVTQNNYFNAPMDERLFADAVGDRLAFMGAG